MIKDQLVPAKDWIIENQNKSGSICWDHRGKCDPWDHCECLIALANMKSGMHLIRALNGSLII